MGVILMPYHLKKGNKMGDMADAMLDGIFDEQTGEYIGEAVGYPRTMQRGYYNSMKGRRPKQGTKRRTSENLGGSHLIGKETTHVRYGKCTIMDYVGRRGQKRYVIIDGKGNEHRVKFMGFIWNNS